jgi:capsular polysaccharide export protein
MDRFRAAGLELQELGARDLPRIQDLLERCAEWWALIHGRAPRDDEAEWLLQDLPPRLDRRRLVGVAAGGGALAGLVDAADGWPERGVTWIGLMLFEPASRSRGLGAALVPPLSLVADDLGIYYDPGRESRLERLIAAPLPPGGLRRAEALVAGLIRGGVTKYNLGGALPPLPPGHRILVPGQVEDDASIRLGGGEVRRNIDLLQLVRARNPGATVIFKPHPDVEAGLRPGAIAEADLHGLADAVVRHGDPAALLAQVAEVWTMTSLLGFEALLRGLPVTCLGAPFYAGWGLTRDLGPVPARRQARPGLAGLVHAALIAYPRYVDPVTGLPCPAEVVAERLATGTVPHPGAANRALAKLQGAFASRAGLWR